MAVTFTHGVLDDMTSAIQKEVAIRGWISHKFRVFGFFGFWVCRGSGFRGFGVSGV